MEEAYSRMRLRGYRIGNVDVTLICQKPRVNVSDQRERLARDTPVAAPAAPSRSEG